MAQACEQFPDGYGLWRRIIDRYNKPSLNRSNTAYWYAFAKHYQVMFDKDIHSMYHIILQLGVLMEAGIPASVVKFANYIGGTRLSHKFIILEIKKLFLPFVLVTMLFAIINVIIAISIRNNYVFFRNIEIWEESNDAFNFIFAILASLPICWVVFFERKNNYIVYTLPRISKKKYILIKWFITGLSGALIVFIISVVGLILSLYVFDPVIAISDVNDFAESRHFAGYYFVHRPLQYGLILSVWRGFIGFLISTMGYILSLYEKNIFVVLTGPFIFTLLSGFILANIHIPEYNLFTSFEPASLVRGSTSPFSFFIGIMILIATIVGIIVFYRFIKKEDIYQI